MCVLASSVIFDDFVRIGGIAADELKLYARSKGRERWWGGGGGGGKEGFELLMLDEVRSGRLTARW